MSTTRTCVACGATETSDHFSRRQWRKGVNRSRCFACVNELDEAFVDASAVRDSGARAHFDDQALEQPFEAGGFRWVALGHYTSGERAGEPCVAKWLIEQDAYSTADYHGDIRCVQRTLDFVRAFNALNIIDLPIRVHVPSTHRFAADTPLPHVVYLREPFIEGYDKWNSNSGWASNESEFADAMQALSHFSYHASGGQHVLCDLQGGLYEDEAVLSDPAILSVTMDYGSTDMGPDGILTFFHQHTCNQFCDESWDTPYNTGQYIESEMSTVVWDTKPENQQQKDEEYDHDHHHEDDYHGHHHHNQQEEENEYEEAESEEVRSEEASEYDEEEEDEGEAEEDDYEEVVSDTDSNVSVSSAASSSSNYSFTVKSHESFYSDDEYEYERESEVSVTTTTSGRSRSRSSV